MFALLSGEKNTYVLNNQLISYTCWELMSVAPKYSNNEQTYEPTYSTIAFTSLPGWS